MGTVAYTCFMLLPCWFGVATLAVTGDMVKADRERAEEMARLAPPANCGDTGAQVALARLLLTRNRNLEAYKWLRLAEIQGNRDAGELRHRMDDPFASTSYALSREEAEAWARAWAPSCPAAGCRPEADGGRHELDGPVAMCRADGVASALATQHG